MRTLKFLLSASLLSTAIFFAACDDEDSPGHLTVSSIVANGTSLETGENVSVDLNATASATDVPLNAVIIVTFSKNVDASTATTTNVQLTQGSNPVEATVSASGADITLTPAAELERGVDYTLTLGAGIKASDGGSFAETSRTFTSAGRTDVVPPQAESQRAYYKFDQDATDSQGDYDADFETGITYTLDRFNQTGSAALFDGNTSLIEVPNGVDLYTDGSVTISFWMKIDTLDHINENGGNAGHFVMGVGNFHGFKFELNGSANTFSLAPTYSKSDGTTGGGDVFFNGDGMSGDNGGFVGIEYERDLRPQGLKSLIAQKWAHIVWTYDVVANKIDFYVNGQLMETDNHSLVPGRELFNGFAFREETGSVIGDKLAFGFDQDRQTTFWDDTPFGNYEITTSNHFKGALDDVRFFGAALTAAEVTALYDAEKP